MLLARARGEVLRGRDLGLDGGDELAEGGRVGERAVVRLRADARVDGGDDQVEALGRERPAHGLGPVEVHEQPERAVLVDGAPGRDQRPPDQP